MKGIALLVVAVTGSLLIYAARDLPAWADPHSPASDYLVSKHYITQSIVETSVPNMVTAVLADYRSYDTLFETVVIFAAGIAIFGILRVTRSERSLRRQVHSGLAPPDLIVQTTCRLLVPVIQLFALYVLAHGHHSPGGGFQGGVIFGASLILIALSYDLRDALIRLSESNALRLAAVGVLIYAGIGLACVLLGENYLDYEILHKILPVGPVESRSLSILGVETGVAFTVSAIMFAIYASLSSRGELKGGL